MFNNTFDLDFDWREYDCEGCKHVAALLLLNYLPYMMFLDVHVCAGQSGLFAF